MPREWGGDWTEDKLAVMHRYFSAYAKALKNQRFEKWYVDAFAGSGERKELRQAARSEPSLFGDDEPDVALVKEGSIRIALAIEPPFDRYVLIEQSKRNVTSLAELRGQFPERRIDILTGDANDLLLALCTRTNWQRVRAAVFIDPYGMQVNWPTLEALARTRAVDIALLFPTGPLNRMLALDGTVPPEWAKRIDNHLGPCDWQRAVYAPSGTHDLFSPATPLLRKAINVEGLRIFVLARLRSIFPFVHENPFELRNSKNSVLYHLFIICANPSARAGQIAMNIASGAVRLPRQPRRR